LALTRGRSLINSNPVANIGTQDYEKEEEEGERGGAEKESIITIFLSRLAPAD